MIRGANVFAILSAIHTELKTKNINAKSNYDNRIKDSHIDIEFEPIERNDKDLVSVYATVYFDRKKNTTGFETLVSNTELAFSKNGLVPNVFRFEDGNLTIEFVSRFELTA